YMGGGVALPNVAVKKTVVPSTSDDDSAVIQAAINEVASLPLKDGFRGAVLLEPGVFTCSQTIRIAGSGVVLRGSGDGISSPGNKERDGEVEKPSMGSTTIKMVGKPHLAIAISRGRGNRGNNVAAMAADATSVPNALADGNHTKPEFKAAATS